MNAAHGSRRRTLVKGIGGAAAFGAVGVPLVGRAQGDAIVIGHLTPRTGFLGPLGEFAVQAADLAVAADQRRRRRQRPQDRAAQGGLGQSADRVHQGRAHDRARQGGLHHRRDLVGLGLTIAQVAERTKTLFVNTGANSDALRGKSCNSYMFHVESQNSMYVKTCGRSLLAQGLVKDKKWFSLTADYAFGHDLLRVAKRFMEPTAASSRPTSWCRPTPPTSPPLLLEIRNAKPDLVISNLAGNQITNFLKQYSEFGLTFPVAGFGFDTAVAWAAGKGNFVGTWPLVWHHLIDTPGSKKFVADFTKNYDKPPENQAWGDYNAIKLTAQAMSETEVDRFRQAGRALRERRQVRRDEDARGLLPRRRPPDDARDVHGDRRCRPRRSGTSGTSSPPSGPVPAPTSRSRRSRRRRRRTSASYGVNEGRRQALAFAEHGDDGDAVHPAARSTACWTGSITC